MQRVAPQVLDLFLKLNSKIRFIFILYVQVPMIGIEQFWIFLICEKNCAWKDLRTNYIRNKARSKSRIPSRSIWWFGNWVSTKSDWNIDDISEILLLAFFENYSKTIGDFEAKLKKKRFISKTVNFGSLFFMEFLGILKVRLFW